MMMMVKRPVKGVEGVWRLGEGWRERLRHSRMVVVMMHRRQYHGNGVVCVVVIEHRRLMSIGGIHRKFELVGIGGRRRTRGRLRMVGRGQLLHAMNNRIDEVRQLIDRRRRW